MLGGLLAGSKQNASKEARTEYAEAFKLGDEAIDSIRVAKRAAQVTVTVKRPDGLDRAGPLVDKIIRAYLLLNTGSGQPRPTPPPRANPSIPNSRSGRGISPYCRVGRVKRVHQIAT